MKQNVWFIVPGREQNSYETVSLPVIAGWRQRDGDVWEVIVPGWDPRVMVGTKDDKKIKFLNPVNINIHCFVFGFEGPFMTQQDAVLAGNNFIKSTLDQIKKELEKIQKDYENCKSCIVI